jgi:hypothetical protein
MASEIALPIIGGVFLGRYLDSTYQTGKVWTAGLALAGVFVGLFLALKDLIKNNKD